MPVPSKEELERELDRDMREWFDKLQANKRPVEKRVIQAEVTYLRKTEPSESGTPKLVKPAQSTDIYATLPEA